MSSGLWKQGQAPAGTPEEMGAGKGHLSPVSTALACCFTWMFLYYCGFPLLIPLGVSPACEPCFLSTYTLPPPDINTCLLVAPVPTLRPKFLRLGNWNTFASVSSYSFPSLPDGQLALSLFQHRFSLTIKLHYPISGGQALSHWRRGFRLPSPVTFSQPTV